MPRRVPLGTRTAVLGLGPRLSPRQRSNASVSECLTASYAAGKRPKELKVFSTAEQARAVELEADRPGPRF
jgi:hypothetical protein